jgi:protein-L-isoaspartate(D-aspartate) O-methyltransferase
VAAPPLLFTVEFRRKMAQLSQEQRQQWLASLAARVRRRACGEGGGGAGPADPVVAQELREVARGCRLSLIENVDTQLGPFAPAHLRALLEVARERFVRPEDIEQSADDTPLPLDDRGLATVSAPHAYLLSYRLLELEPGDSLVELGTGSGYGAALAAFIVGPRGRVLTFEIDGELAAWARRTLEDEPNVTVMHADAMTSAPLWGGAAKVVVTFAVDALPVAWLDALPEGGRLVAPVGDAERDQRLVRIVRERGRLVRSEHGAVRYVRNRSTR